MYITAEASALLLEGGGGGGLAVTTYILYKVTFKIDGSNADFCIHAVCLDKKLCFTSCEGNLRKYWGYHTDTATRKLFVFLLVTCA